jgi:hypothetical protein
VVVWWCSTVIQCTEYITVQYTAVLLCVPCSVLFRASVLSPFSEDELFANSLHKALLCILHYAKDELYSVQYTVVPSWIMLWLGRS